MAAKQGKALEKSLDDVIFAYSYPRLDVEVTKKMNHLLKVRQDLRMMMVCSRRACDEFGLGAMQAGAPESCFEPSCQHASAYAALSLVTGRLLCIPALRNLAVCARHLDKLLLSLACTASIMRSRADDTLETHAMCVHAPPAGSILCASQDGQGVRAH